MLSRFFIVITFLFFCNSLYSQSNIKKNSLENVLTLLEEIHQIKFSYKTSNIKGASLIVDKEAELIIQLEAIRKQTSHFVQKIDERYYLVLSKVALGKITLCGTLIDNFTKTAVENATIINLTTNRESLSDTDGYFELYLAEPNDAILIRAVGYESKRLNASYISGKPCPTIELIEQRNRLDEVLITEYLKNDLDAIGREDNISFNPNEIGVLPSLVEPDVFETLQILPGVQGASESASELLIRGGNPDQNLVLWDGIRMYNTGHLLGAVSVVNPYITENVDLYRGDGAHPKFGGALGGIVSISSISEVPQKITGSIGSTLIALDTNVQVPIGERVAMVVSARSSLNRFFDNPVFDVYKNRATQGITLSEERERGDSNITSSDLNTVPEFSDFAFRTFFDGDKDHIGISSFYNVNSLESALNRVSVRDTVIFRSDDGFFLVKKAYGGGFKWIHNYSEKLKQKLAVNTSYNSNTLPNEDDTVNAASAEASEDLPEEPIENLRDITGAFSYSWMPNKLMQLDLGYNFNYLEIQNNYLNGFNFGRVLYGQGRNFNRTHALFSNFRIDIKNWFSYEAGIRTSQFSILDNVKLYWEPRTIMRLKLSKKLRLRFSYDQHNQILHQLSFLYREIFSIEANPWVLIDPDIYDSPLQSKQLSAGFRFNHRTWDINVDIYSKKTNNINTGIRGFQQVTNLDIGRSKTEGMDILVKKRIGKYRSIATYSYINQFFFFDGLNRNTQFPGNFDTTHSFAWSHTYNTDKFEFALGWNYRTGIPYTNFGGIFRVDFDTDISFSPNDLLNNTRLSPYHRLDFSTSYKFDLKTSRGWKCKLTFSLLNIYNRENELSVIFVNAQDSEDENEGVRPTFLTTKSIGFTPNLGLRIMF